MRSFFVRAIIIENWIVKKIFTFNRVKSIRRKVGGVLRELVEDGVASRDC